MKKFTSMMKAFSIIALLLIAGASKAQTPTGHTAGAEKKVAILPMSYANDGSNFKMDEMRYRLQNLIYLYLNEKTVELKFQDPAETNALLLKNGVREANFREFTPKEIAAILGVEYYLAAVVIQAHTGMASQKNYQTEENGHSRERMEHSKAMQEMNTTIDMNVYNSKGESVYNKSRRSIWSTADAYKNCLEYLLKRSPLYQHRH